MPRSMEYWVEKRIAYVGKTEYDLLSVKCLAIKLDSRETTSSQYPVEVTIPCMQGRNAEMTNRGYQIKDLQSLRQSLLN